MEDITINKLELASELAERRVYEHFKYSTPEAMYENPYDGITSYTEEAQGIFNEWYEYYLDIIEECKR